MGENRGTPAADRLRRFHDGTEHQAWEWLGAHREMRDGQEGVAFRLWAPHAADVSVINEKNGWLRSFAPMQRMEEDPDTISQFANTDIAVLRSGKAKKNDPPIPADLAPISGSGKRPRQQERKEEAMVLEPIRFRYREEALVEEPAQQEEPEKASEKQSEKPSRSRRRKRSAEGAQTTDRAEKPAEKKEKPAPKQKEPDVPAEGDTPAGDPAKKHRRRPNRRKKPAKPQEG